MIQLCAGRLPMQLTVCSCRSLECSVSLFLKMFGDRVFTVKTEMTLFFWEHFYSIYEERW